jgi:hypothetical protein
MISEQGNRFLCWRRDDITSPSAELSAEVIAAFTLRTTHHLPSSPGYTPFTVIDSPGATNATKLRFPYHLGASSDDRKLYRFDLLASYSHSPNTALTTIDISSLWSRDALADPAIYYVEILQQYCLVAGSRSITFWHPDRGCVSTFPPEFPPSFAREDEFVPIEHHYRDERRLRWSAVHHDVRGGGDGSGEGGEGEVRGNLVAVTYGERGEEGSGKLMWTPRVGKVLEGASAQEVARMTVVLQAVSRGRLSFESLRPELTATPFPVLPHRPACRRERSLRLHHRRRRSSQRSLDAQPARL